MNKIRNGFLLFGLFILLFNTQSLATIAINSIATTVSTCGNNGTATVNATSSKSNPFLMYEIVSGPSTALVQNSSTFSSLYPGTYTVRVYDIDFVSKDGQFTITGNYQLPAFNPLIESPTCPGSTDGKITGNATASRGKAPFTWQLTSPAGSAQASDVFKNLSTGSYTIKMTDACGNFQTRTAILASGGTGLAHFSDGIPTVVKIGCDTVVITMQIKLYKEKAKKPLKLTLYYSGGSRTKYVVPIPRDTINYVPGFYEIKDTIGNITYNSFLNACLDDVCGKSLCATNYRVSPFEFYLEYKTSLSCGDKMSATIFQKNPYPYPNYTYTTFIKPGKMTMLDVATNTIADSMSCNNTYCNFVTKELISGRTYKLTIVDKCGQVFTQNIVWPYPAKPYIQTNISNGCLDSTATVGMGLLNFKGGLTLEILSGPKYVKSSKAKYAYSDSVSYPKVFKATRTGFALKNLAAGSYQYRVKDTCGNIVTGSFVVLPSQVSNFKYTYSIKKGCLGDNILYFNPISSPAIGVYIRNAATNAIIYKRSGAIAIDSMTSLAPGKYVLQIYYGFDYVYGGGIGYDGYLTDAHSNCWLMSDTITIPPYTNNSFKSNTTIYCNGTSYLQLNVDSNRGVAPYKYEIIGGPKTFPLQNSNIFQLPSYGNYVIRIQDACGNSNVSQISVDSAKFPPVIKKGASCVGNKIVLKGVSSSFFTYEWKKPNGIVYKGDSLVINPLGPADTGLYIVTKKVSINGCTDVFSSSYRVRLNDVSEKTIPFCKGSSVQLGTKIYTAPGIHKDTLINSSGCDSVVITYLVMLPQKIDTNQVVICKGNHITLGSNVYSTPGTYKDSVKNSAGCYDIVFTKLKVNGIPDTINRKICAGNGVKIGSSIYKNTGIYTDTLMSKLGCDSIIVLKLVVTPYKKDSIVKVVCYGNSFKIASHTYTQTGIYRDTLSTATCDSIVILNLTVLPQKKDSLVHTICQGHSITVGTHTYNQTGVYKDTLTTATCDSIVILNLTVLPYKYNSIVRQICQGQSIAVGTHTYNQTGIYKDTLATATCDSIVTLNLTVATYKRNQLVRSICEGQSFTVGIHTYNQTGIYHDTLATATCDSIVTLNLTIEPLPSVYLGKDTFICQGQTITLKAESGYSEYYWNDDFAGSVKKTLTVNASGKYWVFVKSAFGCISKDTLEILSVYPLPVADAGQDKTICEGENILLQASGGDYYKWLPGEENQSMQVHPEVTTSYKAIVYTNHGCSSSDEVTVFVNPIPRQAVFESQSLQHCFDEGALTIGPGWGRSFIWTQTGDTSQYISVTQAGSYQMKVYGDNGCYATGEVSVKDYCKPKLFVPKAFSPNQDGENDDLEIFGKNFKNFKITIFNRWGEIIFISNDRNIRWDGMYRGEEMQIGTYPWMISYRSVYEEDPEENTVRGSVTLIR